MGDDVCGSMAEVGASRGGPLIGSTESTPYCFDLTGQEIYHMANAIIRIREYALFKCILTNMEEQWPWLVAGLKHKMSQVPKRLCTYDKALSGL